MTSCILMSRSSSVAADTASFRGETKAGMRTGVAGKTGRESASLSTRGMSSEDPGCERERWADITIWPHTPTPPPSSPTAAMATGKNIYSVFRDDSAFYSESRTQWLAAFIMTGCVKHNAMISGASNISF